MNIKVNGSDQQLADTTTHLSYETVCNMAGFDGSRVLSVMYKTRRKGDEQRSGLMHRGCDPVRVEDGMIFNVADTSNA